MFMRLIGYPASNYCGQISRSAKRLHIAIFGQNQSCWPLRDVRRLVVAMSRARLGLYIFARVALFRNCFELAPAFEQHEPHGQLRLHSYMGRVKQMKEYYEQMGHKWEKPGEVQVPEHEGFISSHPGEDRDTDSEDEEEAGKQLPVPMEEEPINDNMEEEPISDSMEEEPVNDNTS
nr:unnamed protein product [Callosobruchus analis]